MLRLSHELDLLDIVDSSKSITQAAFAFFPIDKIRRSVDSREFKQIATAGATTAAVTEKVWGEYVAAVCQILAK